MSRLRVEREYMNKWQSWTAPLQHACLAVPKPPTIPNTEKSSRDTSVYLPPAVGSLTHDFVSGVRSEVEEWQVLPLTRIWLLDSPDSINVILMGMGEGAAAQIGVDGPQWWLL